MQAFTISLIIINSIISNFVDAAVISKKLNHWKQDKIEVCWWKPGQEIPTNMKDEDSYIYNFISKKNLVLLEKSEAYKNKIRNIIQEHYNYKSIGLDFVGWSDCIVDQKADLKILAIDEIEVSLDVEMTSEDFKYFDYLTKRGKHKAQIGYQKDGNFMILFDSLYENSHDNFNIVSLALHEFAHTLGLKHEHFRKEAVHDEACRLEQRRLWRIDKKNKQYAYEWKQRKFLSSYDKESIMNECHTETFNFYHKLIYDGLEQSRKAQRYKIVYDKKFPEDKVAPSPLDLKALREIIFSKSQ